MNTLNEGSWYDGGTLSSVEGSRFTDTSAMSSTASAGVGGGVMSARSGPGAVAFGVGGVATDTLALSAWRSPGVAGGEIMETRAMSTSGEAAVALVNPSLYFDIWDCHFTITVGEVHVGFPGCHLVGEESDETVILHIT